jgi:hypothetical protein
MKKVIVGAVIAFAVAMILLAFRGSSLTGLAALGKYDGFAKCLSDRGVIMYGAYWCSHCQNQKEMFGSSWKYVTYVECSLPNRAGQTKECQEKGISGYPTWDIRNELHSGELSFAKLAELTGCELP